MPSSKRTPPSERRGTEAALGAAALLQGRYPMKGHRGSRNPSVPALAGVALQVCILAFASSASAQTAARKFGRGLAGMTAGVLELPGDTVPATRTTRARGKPSGR